MFFSSRKIEVDLSYNKIKMISLANAEAVAHQDSYADIDSKSVDLIIENNPLNCDCDLYNLLRYQEGEMPKFQAYAKLELTYLKCLLEPTMFVKVTQLKSETFRCRVENPEIYNATCPQGCTCWLRPKHNAYQVDCSYTNITKAPESLKSPQGHTIKLNLIGNFIKKMPSMIQPGYDSVTVFSLSKKQITEVPLDALSHNLQVLNLDSTNLTRLDTPVLKFWNISTELRNLTLHMNPWACDCDSQEFLSFIQQKVGDISGLNKVHCANSDKPIKQMTPEDMCPQTMAVIIGACIGVAVLGILIGIIISLYSRFQQEIKVWLYAHQWCLWFVTEDELDKDKLYDAFISYSHKDEDFVQDLVAKLEEGDEPFKLCVQYRDWPVGEWIPTQIVQSVEDSRRTVVVVSPNFLESIWEKMILRTAYNQALTEGRARVVVILYGEIRSIDQLDPKLRAYLTMNTYVKWGDPSFWEKLKYALPHSGRLIKKKKEAKCI